MQRYESLPAECLAFQFTEEKTIPEVVGVEVKPGRSGHPVEMFYVTTAHGQRAYLTVGDYIVAEPDGRGFYPVKPDIFVKRWRLKDGGADADCYKLLPSTPRA